jgi:SH3-like domain-containing protein
MSTGLPWEVYHRTWRRFRTFEAAESWARQQVAMLDDKGCAESAEIWTWDDGVVAEVRMSGDGRVWTDIKSPTLSIASE